MGLYMGSINTEDNYVKEKFVFSNSLIIVKINQL
jgi:hypothetical protein